MICYVCGGAIQSKPHYIGGDTYRHIRCAPGSERWLASQKAKRRKDRSEYYEYFLLGRVKHD